MELAASKKTSTRYRNVSFVGRPFLLEDAEEHFQRLYSWGLRFLRFVVTWEAVEHSGPGEFDQDYLDYLRAVVEMAARLGITVYIDPHQDVWSRWTGGDGAPAWTLEKTGFNLKKLHASGAAILHQELPPGPRMVWDWTTNYNRLACATMFSLFYGGNEFAPGIKIDGESVQDYLQGHFIESMSRVASTLKGLSNVCGLGSLNEPSLGFLGLSDLSRLERAMLKNGAMPSPWQAILAGSGYPQKVENWHMGYFGNYVKGMSVLNPNGEKAWEDGIDCLWKRVGVWDDSGGKPILKRPGHFRCAGNPAEIYMKPFMLSFLKVIREIEPKSIFFIEGVPNAEHPTWGDEDSHNVVNASHWYDNVTVITKRYQDFFNFDIRAMKFCFGPWGIRRYFRKALGYWKEVARSGMGGIPTLIGEFGLPFDINRAAAYRTGDFRRHEKALDAYYQAMDANLLSATIWNYSADNSNDLGDKWNDEDMSIYSPDSRGARALKGFCRPYAAKTAGTPLYMSFDFKSARFEYRFLANPKIEAPTEIFLPECHYPSGYSAKAEGDEGILLESAIDVSSLLIRPPKGCQNEIRVVVFKKQQ